VTAIWGTDPNGRWLPLAPTAYLAEAELHYLVGNAPEMLPLAGTPQLTVLGREVRLGSGYADLLAVESTGRLVVIEVKLSLPSMFEPVHGSAPGIAGLGVANPIGAISSAALMLEHLGLQKEADRINRAIDATTAAGILTRDLGGDARTSAVAAAIIDNL